MESTYDYRTGQMTLGYHIVKENEVCKLPYSTPARVGGWSCKHCPYHGGWIATERFAPFDFFYKCKHPKAVNSKHEEVNGILNACYDELERRALCAFYG